MTNWLVTQPTCRTLTRSEAACASWPSNGRLATRTDKLKQLGAPKEGTALAEACKLSAISIWWEGHVQRQRTAQVTRTQVARTSLAHWISRFPMGPALVRLPAAWPDAVYSTNRRTACFPQPLPAITHTGHMADCPGASTPPTASESDPAPCGFSKCSSLKPPASPRMPVER